MRHVAHVLVALALLTGSAMAQGWSDDRGTLSLTSANAYEWSDATFHTTSFLVSGVPSDSLQFNLEAEYVPIDRLTIKALMMTTATRYSGPQTGATPDIIVAHGSNDDGSFHYTPTDLELEARYSVLDSERFGLSPALRGQIPVHDYEVRGYAASGSGLKELGAGLYFNVAQAGFERSFLAASYFFTLVEKESLGGADTEMYSVHRSDASIRWGYGITDAFTVAAGVSGRITHGGVDLENIRMVPMGAQMYHDPILRKDYLTVNALASYQLLDSLSVTASFAFIPIGLNVSNAKIVNLMLTWTVLPWNKHPEVYED